MWKNHEHLSWKSRGLHPGVSGSHTCSKHPCLQVSSGFRATALKCAFEASLVSLPEMYNTNNNTTTTNNNNNNYLKIISNKQGHEMLFVMYVIGSFYKFGVQKCDIFVSLLHLRCIIWHINIIEIGFKLFLFVWQVICSTSSLLEN